LNKRTNEQTNKPPQAFIARSRGMSNELGELPTSITGAGRSACPQEGAGNLSERFLAKLARHAQWHKYNGTVSGERKAHQRRQNGFWRN
jgi:hypothetical protein